MSSLLLIAALGVGAMYYLNTQNQKKLQEQIDKNNEELYYELQQQIQEGKISRDDITDGVYPDAVMIGISSISDKYWNCAAGLIWKNDTNEPINVKLDSGTFNIGGYDMKVGATNLPTITVPAKGEIYQALFAYENHTLFTSKSERDAVRVVIGTAQGHAGKQGRDVWGKANFECKFTCTYSPVGSISKVPGEQAVLNNIPAVGRYYGSTALKGRLASWVRSYIDTF